jgi:hypothetical protein
MTTTELVYASASLEERKGYALALSRAGDLVPKGFRDRDGSANPGKILLAAEYGNMLGLHPMAALTGINVIDGKPSPSPALMTALVRAAGHKLRVRSTGTVKAKTIAVTVTLIRTDDPDNPFESTWDVDKATRAELWGKPGSWTKYPEAMLKWRAISEVCRDGAEDVLLGAHYVPEELGAEVNESGEVIELTAAAERTPPRRPTTPAPQPAAEQEPLDAEEVAADEQPTEAPAEPAPTGERVYVQEEADEWAAQISATTRLGNPKDKGAIDADTLAGVWLRAQRADVLTHLIDDPDRVAEPLTIDAYIAQRRIDLQTAVA